MTMSRTNRSFLPTKTRKSSAEWRLVGIAVPERAFCVKGLLAGFLTHGQRKSPTRAFFSRFPRFVVGVRILSNCRARSFFSRLSSRSLPRGCTPTHPFVNPSAVADGRSDSQEPDTEYSAATVSLCMDVSIRVTLGYCAESTGLVRLALQARASSSSEEGPMQPPTSFRSPSLRFLGFPLSPSVSTIRMLGEAESGSAGTQPDKE